MHSTKLEGGYTHFPAAKWRCCWYFRVLEVEFRQGKMSDCAEKREHLLEDKIGLAGGRSKNHVLSSSLITYSSGK